MMKDILQSSKKNENKNSFLLFLIIILLFPNVDVFSQSGGKGKFSVEGKIVDAQSGAPLEYSTVSLFNAQDSSLVDGNITDEEGSFAIEAPQGSYYIEVKFISYKDKIIDDINLDSSNPKVQLPEIKLSADTRTLSEVVVSGEKDQMELSLDKRVFNVASDLTNVGRNAAEILDNVPSVTVDVDGNVSLRGSGNVRILVDGKPSGLVGISSTDALRMLQGDLIERVEVITNPSARYDAEGMAGIINIILKKDKRAGVNGSFTLNLGYPTNYGASFNVNMRRKWFNLFSSYGFNYRESPGSGSSYQEFYLPDSTYFTDRSQSRNRTGFGHNFRFGSDFYLNEKNIITASFLYRISDQKNFSNINYLDYNSLRELNRQTVRQDNEMEDEQNLEWDVNYSKTFDRKDQKLTADVQYRRSNEIEKSDIEERILFNNTNEGLTDITQRSSNDENDRNLLIQSDYVHPFGENGKLEVGTRNTFRRIETDFIVEQLEENNNWRSLSGFTNQFNYDEKIYGVYAIFGNKINRFSYQAGLRTELTDLTTELIETNERYDKNYLNLFPSAHLTYDLKKQNSLQASYSRRLNRPRFWDLNPFFTYSDARNIRAGNPDLNPEYTNSYEVGYLKNWKNSSVYYGAYYRQTSDVIERISTLINDSTTLSSPQNLSARNSYGVEANISKDITEWWKVNLNANFFRAITNGNYNDQDLSSDTYSMTSRLNSRITFLKDFNFQTNINYRAPEETPQGRSRSMYFIDLAVNKDILQGKGTLTLSVSDLLNSRRWRSETYGENFYANSEFQWRARQIMATFTYRLNQKKQNQGDRRGDGDGGGGGDEEF